MSTHRVIEAITALMKAPRTIPELNDVMDVGNKDQGYRYVYRLKEDGLVYISEWKIHAHNVVAVYAWQPSLFHHADATRPTARGWMKRVKSDSKPYAPRVGSRTESIVQHILANPQTTFRVFQLARKFHVTRPVLLSCLRAPTKHGLIERIAERRHSSYRAPKTASSDITNGPNSSCCSAAPCVCTHIPHPRDSGTRIASRSE